MSIMELSATSYHNDTVADKPTLSASIAAVLCTQSPAHAWVAHPRLNPNFERKDEKKFDVGTAAHALLLEGETAVCIVPGEKWNTNKAKALVAEARADGQTPMKEKDWDAVQAMVAAIRVQLDRVEAHPPLLVDGKPEQTLVWEEPNGVGCRARLDWLRDDLLAVDDLKTSGRSVRADKFSRNLYDLGYDVKAAFYLRGCERLSNASPVFRWINVETSPPFAVSVVEATPEVLAVGTGKVEHALALWRECLASDEWPAYPPQVVPAGMPPPWEMERWAFNVEDMEVPW